MSNTLVLELSYNNKLIFGVIEYCNGKPIVSVLKFVNNLKKITFSHNYIICNLIETDNTENKLSELHKLIIFREIVHRFNGIQLNGEFITQHGNCR
jgi:hypothetical protein